MKAICTGLIRSLVFLVVLVSIFGAGMFVSYCVTFPKQQDSRRHCDAMLISSVQTIKDKPPSAQAKATAPHIPESDPRKQ